jgi:hypothetical protein
MDDNNNRARPAELDVRLGLSPNKALHLTAYSVRCAPAFGSR